MVEMSMIRLGNAIRILAVPCVLAGFAAGADASAAKPAKTASVVKMASGAELATPAPATPVAVQPTPAAVSVASVPACARKVKVIYAGYGEADRAGCSVASAETTTP